MTALAPPSENQLNEKLRSWFEDFMHDLRVDYTTLEANVASDEKHAFYNRLANGNATDIASMSRVQSSLLFLQNLIVEYLNELQIRQCRPLKLALDLSDAKVLVWAEIRDDDEATEDQLRLAQAKVNARYNQYGFHVTSTIVEEGDFLPVPSHYQPIF